MKLSRRDLTGLVSLLAVTKASAQTRPSLPSKIYKHSAVAYSGNEQKKGRQFFRGVNRSGFDFEMHETILGPGTETHPPHKHVHEEIVIVVEGTVEAYLEGNKELAEAGSVLYFGSNQMHNARNAGKNPCRYYVIELRGDQ
jgi:quercetin dioxygenase-like cupin family protein